jgi:5-oxoprolinase (ATP-hydrolysing) subunit C
VGRQDPAAARGTVRGASQALDVLEVLDGGLQATIQDRGRRGHEAEGVPRSGAADALALAIANLLLGNPPDGAAIEITLLGLRVRALVDVDLGLAGADLRTSVAGEPVGAGRAFRLRAGETLDVLGRTTEDPAAPPLGCRAYLAVPAGVHVPILLGSRSTCLPAGFGGLAGRALRAGDRIAAASTTAVRRVPAELPAAVAAGLPTPAQRLRILPGPASAEADPAFRRLLDQSWIVSAASDRRGLRLEPADPNASSPDDGAALGSGELPSLGVLPGVIQVTPSGQPLVLMPDAGTTGGYPVVAVVIDTDLPLLGQLAPGAEVRFRPTTLDAAREAAIERRQFIAEVASRLP